MKSHVILRVTEGLLVGITLLASFLYAQPAELTVSKSGRTLEIQGTVPGGPAEVEIRIESTRNRSATRLTEVSRFDPMEPWRERLDSPNGFDMWYPVLDLVPPPGMQAIAEFDAAPEACGLNHHFDGKIGPCGQRLQWLAAGLEYWENSIYVRPVERVLRRFYMSHVVPVQSEVFRLELELLSEDWSGAVAVYPVDGGEQLATRSWVDVPEPPPANLPDDDLSRERLLNSLAATIGYTLRAQQKDPNSPARGGLHLFYDLDARLHRTSYWVWGWGPSVQMLLDAAEIPELATEFGAGQLRQRAREITDASIRFQIDEPGHPADGIPIGRWDRGLNFPEDGYLKCATASDANFLSRWAWIPVYEHTGEERYLDAARKLAEVTDRIMDEFALVPQDYWPNQKRWSDHTLNESGFGIEGFAALYRVTGEERYREMGRRYTEQHLDKFQRDDGFWQRAWRRSRGAQETHRMTRGQGWAMEGLLAANRMFPNGKYLDLAERLGEILIRHQLPDGSWAFIMDQPASDVGVSDKGTALWSLLLYQLYEATGESRHLDAAREALRWCLNHQYPGPDPEARGSIVARTKHSAVGYRPWYRVSCTYASAFFGLAVLEELRLSAER